jgi:hypothetical protein
MRKEVSPCVVAQLKPNSREFNFARKCENQNEKFKILSIFGFSLGVGAGFDLRMQRLDCGHRQPIDADECIVYASIEISLLSIFVFLFLIAVFFKQKRFRCWLMPMSSASVLPRPIPSCVAWCVVFQVFLWRFGIMAWSIWNLSLVLPCTLCVCASAPPNVRHALT